MMLSTWSGGNNVESRDSGQIRPRFDFLAHDSLLSNITYCHCRRVEDNAPPA